MPTNYRIFLLTVWRDDSAADRTNILRFSLHDHRSDQRRGFGDIDALLAFLNECLDEREEAGGDEAEASNTAA